MPTELVLMSAESVSSRFDTVRWLPYMSTPSTDAAPECWAVSVTPGDDGVALSVIRP